MVAQPQATEERGREKLLVGEVKGAERTYNPAAGAAPWCPSAPAPWCPSAPEWRSIQSVAIHLISVYFVLEQGYGFDGATEGM